MRVIINFPIASVRRQAESCRLKWYDNGKSGRTGVAHNAKYPSTKDGIHQRFSAGHVLAREDLRFHEPPRVATSQLFEHQCRIREVVQFSLL